MKEYKNCRNPVFPPEIMIPDGEAHVFGERLYVYGSFDTDSEKYCSEEYYVASTGDMKNWTLHEKSLDGKYIPWLKGKHKSYPAVDFDMRKATPAFKKLLREMGVPIDRIPKSFMPKSLDLGKFCKEPETLYAPDCAYKNGRYYLYFCNAGSLEGVAVSDSPTGPFKDAVQLPCGGIDPAVFVDDDGKAYYYWGQFRAAAVPLNEDMLSFDESKIVRNIVTEEEHGFHEGSSMRKRNGIYYYVYPCVYRNERPTCLAYATSDSPLGPFTYRGIIIDNAKCDPESWNIHGCIEQFGDQWYVFYHRSSKNSRNRRRLCVEPIFFNEDGTINEVKMTSQGAGKPFTLGEEIAAWHACEVEGGAYIDCRNLIMKDGSSVVFRYIDIAEKISSVHIEAQGNGSIEALIGGKPAEQAELGLQEIKLICKGEMTVQSIRFE